MAVSRLDRLAARAPAAVYPALGTGSRDAVRLLVADPRIELVASPRHATVLLIAGAIPRDHVEALEHVHDQLPLPRATVWWTDGGADELRGILPALVTVAPDGDVGGALQAVHRDLFVGDRAPDADLLRSDHPVDWKGVGPYGTGGEGMMGGVPYGRPMAMTGDDLRDGLALDELPLRLGPYLPGFPPGLVLDLVLQGDVIQSLEVVAPAHDDHLGTPLDDGDPFRRVQREPVGVADLELARARAHLGHVADLLRLQGLDGLAARTARLASQLDAAGAAHPERVTGLRRWLERSHALTAATAGVGRIPEDRLPAGASGPVARASGRVTDTRTGHPAYAGLDFRPVHRAEGDVRARWRQRLTEAEQSLDLAGRAGDREVAPDHPVETPLGSGPDGDDAVLGLLPELLRGMEWGDALSTLASLDLASDRRRSVVGGAAA